MFEVLGFYKFIKMKIFPAIDIKEKALIRWVQT